MADIQSVSDLVTQRDKIQASLNELADTAINMYTLGGRTVTYELRNDLQKQLNQLNRRIAARTTSGTKALGFNLADFSQKTEILGQDEET